MGSYGLWLLVLVQAGIFLAAAGGPPPSSVGMLGGSALLLWIFIPWAAWIDRHRRVTSPPVTEAVV
jgi:hypothetical protein